MTLEELTKQWAKDSEIDRHDLTGEALKIPKLHHKYYTIYVKEKLKLQKLKLEQEELEHILDQFYGKKLTDEELEEYGLEFPDKVILKAEKTSWVNTDKNNVAKKMEIGFQLEKVEYLKSIIQQIGNRSFVIRDAIEFLKFSNGA